MVTKDVRIVEEPSSISSVDEFNGINPIEFDVSENRSITLDEAENIEKDSLQIAETANQTFTINVGNTAEQETTVHIGDELNTDITDENNQLDSGPVVEPDFNTNEDLDNVTYFPGLRRSGRKTAGKPPSRFGFD